MFNKKGDNAEFNKQKFIELERRKDLFIIKFVEYFFAVLEQKENIAIKREAPQLTGMFKRGVQTANISGMVIAPAGDIGAAAAGVPVPAGSVVKLGTDITGGLIKYFGRRAANKKTKQFIRFIEQNERYELETLLTEAAEDIAIAFEYHLSHLKGDLDILRMSATASDLLAIYLSGFKGQEISFTKENIIFGIFESAYNTKMNKVIKLITGVDRGKNMEVENDLDVSWYTKDLFSKTGLLTKESEHKIKEVGSDSEVYGFRRELSPDLDKKYTNKISGNQQKHYNDWANTWYVVAEDLTDFAQAVKNGDIEQTKSFNSYISDRYASGRNVIAVCKNQVISVGYKLENLNLSGSYFIDMDFSGVSLINTNLTKAYMPNIKFIDTDLSGAKLIGAYLVRGEFQKATILDTDFSDSDMTCANLEEILKINKGTKFISIKRTGIKYNGTKLEEAIIDLSLSDILKDNIELEKKLEKIYNKYNKLDKYLEDEAKVERENDADTQEKISQLQSKLSRLKKQLQKIQGERNIYSNTEIYIGPKFVSNLYRGSNFTRLQQALKREHVVVISGIQGSGATQLARYYAHHYFEQEPQNIVYEINAETLDSLKLSYRLLAATLAVTKDEKELQNKSIEEIQGLVCKELLQKFRKGYLLLFNGVDSLEVRSEIKNYLPKGNGNVIITTQDNTLSLLFNSTLLSIEEWSKEEACLYIIKKLKSKNIKVDFSKVELLATKLNYSTLGIDIATLYIKTKNISVAEYIKELDKELGNRIEKLEALKAAVSLSINNLDKYEKNILKLCSFLSTNSIPLWLLQAKVQNMYPHFHEHKCLVVLESYIKTLSEYSLIAGIEGKGSNRLLYLHQTVKEVSKSLLTPKQEQKKVYINQVSNILSKHVARDNNNKERYEKNQLLMPHIESLVLNAAMYNIPFTPNMLYLQVCRGVFYGFIGEHERANGILSEQKERIESLLGADDLLDTGKIYTKLKAISRDLPTLYAQVLYHLGRSCMSISLEDEESKQYFEDAVSIRGLIDHAVKEDKEYEVIDKKYNEGKPRPMDSTIFRRGGVILWYNLRGYKEHNIEYLGEALKEYEYLLQKEDEYPEEIKDTFNRGFCRIGIADIKVKIAALTQSEEERVKLCEEALEVACDHLREGLKMEIGKDISQLAPQALYEKLESIVKTSSNTRAAREYELLGKIFQVRGIGDDLEHAEKFFIRAKELDSGRSHLTGNVLYGLACIYKKQGRIEEAKASLEKCIEVRTKIDPKMVYKAEELLKNITPQEHVHKQEGMVKHIKVKEKADDIKPITTFKETRLARVRSALLKEIGTKKIEPGREEVELNVIGTEEEIEACCKGLGISKESYKIEEQEKVGDSNQRSKVYINVKALEQVREQLGNKEIGK